MNLEGVLLLNKPQGMTSHDCVNKVRRILGMKKVGHTGTLDPDVDGVLPICVGRATKLSQFLTAETKTYEGEVTLGYSTTTEDASGEIVEQKSVDTIPSDLVVGDVLRRLIGKHQQTPPMFSAVKVGGKKLYEYARAGIAVERQARDITIHELELTSEIVQTEAGLVKFSFRVKASKGTFVRTLAVTIGEMLGYPAHMSNLTRVASGHFDIASCIGFDELEQAITDSKLVLTSVEEALEGFPAVTVTEAICGFVKNGVKLRDYQVKPAMKDGPFAIFDAAGACLAIYEFDGEMYRSVRGLL